MTINFKYLHERIVNLRILTHSNSVTFVNAYLNVAYWLQLALSYVVIGSKMLIETDIFLIGSQKCFARN